MHEITFYPVGNGDSSQIKLASGKRILFDFRHLSKSETPDIPEIDLAEALRDELTEDNRDYFDVVAFTHADTDHIRRSTEFFELRHAEKYQGSNRIKIRELWVPAAMILESCEPQERSDEFVIWRTEARHRLKEGKGIRVFSKPSKLKDWLEANALTLESRKHLITDAGQVAPGFTLDHEGIEFFCHSPFIKHVDNKDEFRNAASLIFNVRMRVGGTTTNYLAVGDSEWAILEDIVEISKKHKNQDRLNWDLFNIPHHCSYLALSDEKGTTETVPKAGVKELLRAGNAGAHLVSSSSPIDDTSAGRQQTQPPHVQAKKCYEHYLKEVAGGRFFVTMEEPNRTKPEPLIFQVSSAGIAKITKPSGVVVVVDSRPPRAG